MRKRHFWVGRHLAKLIVLKICQLYFTKKCFVPNLPETWFFKFATADEKTLLLFSIKRNKIGQDQVQDLV